MMTSSKRGNAAYAVCVGGYIGEMTHSSRNHLRAQEYKITKIPQSPLKIFKNQPMKTRQNPNHENFHC
jgi:hypothetical protein